jgi:ferrous iron transport protein B
MPLTTVPRPLTVALVGNPNTGKSTLFSALSGVQQQVGNYAGVTVAEKLGQLVHAGRVWTLVDLPGTYSLAPRSPDEAVTVDALLGRSPELPEPDVLLCVVSAVNLERNLYLVSQAFELGRPTVIALTMLDVAQAHGQAVDVSILSLKLGVPVVAVQAHRRLGLGALKAAIEETAERPPELPASPLPAPFHEEVAAMAAFLSRGSAARNGGNGSRPLPRYLVERLLLDRGGYIEDHLPLNGDRAAVRARLKASRDRLAEAGCVVPDVETYARHTWAASIADAAVTLPVEPLLTLGDRIDRVVTHRFVGVFILVVVLTLIFSAVFSWARVPMDWIEAGVAALERLIESSMGEGPLRSLLIDGVIRGIGAVVVFLPQIAILFFFLTVLEECGYLGRAAYLMDKLMVRVGLSGKSFIPLLSSFACAIPGVMAARIIENRRDRFTTILIAPLMSCSARLPVYTLMIAAFVPERRYLGGVLTLPGLTLLAMYLLGIVMAAAVAFVLRRTLLRGDPPPLVIELPNYRWPPARVVLQRVFERSWDFVRNAGTVIFAVSIVMWAALAYPQVPASRIAPLAAERARLESRLVLATAGADRAAVELELATVRARIDGVQKRQSVLGRLGRWLEPAVRPLGWDWRIASSVIASFTAREVVVASLGVIFDAGADASAGKGLRDALRSATWQGTSRTLFTVPVALSIMVFFALCAQCVGTLVVIGRETKSWGMALFCFTYLTTLAYLGALVTYQVGTWLGF